MSDLHPRLGLDDLRRMMSMHGVRQLLVKELAPNDNSKNQPYFGGSLDILNVLPMGELREETSPNGRVGLKASLPLSWLRADGSLTTAKGAQLILYPQYPEIRFSGFLKGTQGGPNALMTVRLQGRCLFLGITHDRRVIGWAAGPESRLVSEVKALGELTRTGVFSYLPFIALENSKDRLIALLGAIHNKGWINSWRMGSRGECLPCVSPQCGGYTLEAELGIVPNGRAEPDFDGWEIKGHSVSSLTSFGSASITLMTPEPTGGYYRSAGVEAFIRKYGYPDTYGRPDRLNFGGVHTIGNAHPRTGLTMQFIGFDPEKGQINDARGGFALFDRKGDEAATWHFAGLIQHWNKKHAKAAYVPFLQETVPQRRYSFGHTVRICEQTNFVRFLQAMASGNVVYDPGIKLEGASGPKPTTKRRSQFRINSRFISQLYEKSDLLRVVQEG